MLYLTPRYYALFEVKLAATYEMNNGNQCELFTIHNFGCVNKT